MSNHIDPMSVDFRAFQVLMLVHRFRSFSKAAETLGVNQSAVSYTIEKLRQVFQDPLFVRQSGKILPTNRCNEIVLRVDGISSDYRQLVTLSTFDPKTVTQKLVIACNYYERVLIIPALIKTLRREAPNLDLEIIDASGIGHEKLLNCDADVLIGPFERSEPVFYRRDLYADRYVCLMDAHHPKAAPDLSIEDYLALDHVLVTYGGLWKSRYLIELEKMGIELPVALRVPSPAGLELIVAGSELVATIPERLSHTFAEGLKRTPCPIQTSITIRLAWAAITHHSPLHRWVRDMIYRVVEASAPGAS